MEYMIIKDKLDQKKHKFNILKTLSNTKISIFKMRKMK